MSRTVLLVDDVRLFLEMQKEFLQNSSVQIMTAQNGIEALEAIRSRRPSLVVMDIEMPRMDGISCCRTLKGAPETASIPVVMVTAKGDDYSQEECRAAGCDAFLTKPLNRSLFLETAGRFLTAIDRREKRRPANLPGTLRSRGITAPCIVEDLSMGGAFLATDLEGEVDRVVELSFTLPDGSVQNCRGKVAWSREKNPRGFGISFILLGSSTKGALTRYLHGGAT